MAFGLVLGSVLAYTTWKKFRARRRGDNDDSTEEETGLEHDTTHMEWHRLRDGGMEFVSLNDNADLQSLTLYNPQLSARGYACLTRLLQSNVPLKRLTLIANNDDEHLFRKLPQETITIWCCQLQELCLEGIVEWENDHMEELYAGLAQTKRLRRLELCDCKWPTQAIVNLCRVLAHDNDTLTSLRISKHQTLSLASCQALAELLEVNTVLQELDLSDCQMEFFLPWIPALSRNTTLKSLHLYRVTGLRYTAALALAKLLEQDKTSLVDLRVDGTEMGRAGARQILNCLATNRTLQTLHLSQTDFSKSNNSHDEALPFHRLLVDHPTLISLDLSALCLRTNEVPLLFQALQHNRTLQCLKIAHVDFSQLVDALTESLPHLHLQHLAHDSPTQQDPVTLKRLAQLLMESNRALETLSIDDDDDAKLDHSTLFHRQQIQHCLQPLHRNLLKWIAKDDQASLALWPHVLERIHNNTDHPHDYLFQYLRLDPSCLVVG